MVLRVQLQDTSVRANGMDLKPTESCHPGTRCMHTPRVPFQNGLIQEHSAIIEPHGTLSFINTASCLSFLLRIGRSAAQAFFCASGNNFTYVRKISAQQ